VEMFGLLLNLLSVALQAILGKREPQPQRERVGGARAASLFSFSRQLQAISHKEIQGAGPGLPPGMLDPQTITIRYVV